LKRKARDRSKKDSNPASRYIQSIVEQSINPKQKMAKLILGSDVNSKENQAKLEAGQRWVFQATFMNYAMAHWTRKLVNV
jgi:hypothetical protein